MGDDVKKYKSKPVTIEAIQWDINNTDKILEFTGDKAYETQERKFSGLDFAGDKDAFVDCPCIVIKTLEGKMCANEGDYIIKGLEGEFYPCKQSIFERKYEEI